MLKTCLRWLLVPLGAIIGLLLCSFMHNITLFLASSALLFPELTVNIVKLGSQLLPALGTIIGGTLAAPEHHAHIATRIIALFILVGILLFLGFWLLGTFGYINTRSQDSEMTSVLSSVIVLVVTIYTLMNPRLFNKAT